MFELPYYNPYERQKWGAYSSASGILIRERNRKIFKTRWQSIAYAMKRQGFEIISVRGNDVTEPKTYTLWGDESALTSGQIQAYHDGILRKIGFEKRRDTIDGVTPYEKIQQDSKREGISI